MKFLKSLTPRKVAIITLSVLLVGLLGWRMFFAREEASADTQPLAVTTTKAIYTEKQPGLKLTGTVEGMTSSVISSRFNGRVESVAVENGMAVSAGQPLLTLDTTELVNAVRVAQNNLRQQEAACAQAQADLTRNQQLYQISAISRQKLDAAETSYVAACSALDNARAELINAQKQAADGTIIAPGRGIVADKAVNPGQIVTAGTTLMTVETIDTVYVTVNVAQKDIASAALGTKAQITVDTYPGEIFTGTVAVINPVAGEDNRMFQVKIKVDNQQGKLLPGMFAQAKIETGEPTKVLAAPRNAVQTVKGLSYVFINDNGRAKKVIVATGELLDSLLEITKGLTEGNEIILDNLDKIKDGDVLSTVSDSTSSGGAL